MVFNSLFSVLFACLTSGFANVGNGQTVTCNSVGTYGSYATDVCYIYNASLSLMYSCASDTELTVTGYSGTSCNNEIMSVTYDNSEATFTCNETDCDAILFNSYTDGNCSGSDIPDEQEHLYVDACLEVGTISIKYKCVSDNINSVITKTYTSDDCSGTPSDTVNEGGVRSDVCYQYDCNILQSTTTTTEMAASTGESGGNNESDDSGRRSSNKILCLFTIIYIVITIM